MTPVVVSLTDPLCGWCFGIAEQLAEAHRRLGDEVTWEVAMGGLVTGERVRPVALDRDYLVDGLDRVAAVTGRRSGAAYVTQILDPGVWVSDSEPACRAVLVAGDLGGSAAAIAVSHGLSDALYLHGRDPGSTQVVRDVAVDAGLDGDRALSRWSEPATAERLQAHWSATRASRLTTYPTIAVRGSSGTVPAVVGFATSADIVAAVSALL